MELDPENMNIWKNKGSALSKLGRYEEAIKCFDKAWEIESGYNDKVENIKFILKNLIQLKPKIDKIKTKIEESF